ncbi:hypothetical protein [Rhodopirellula baltica]|uniref:Transmembrane protein n=1 Tax=Rhodopirellula baltica WH47 TaxID=991778 RepID=F2AP76_RHOBT|nr:hypothetical protein [Rhodopirellula baltica]EGF28535.1 conserved hypothetical protein, membrane [Rhodopirellula baltica WH47]
MNASPIQQTTIQQSVATGSSANDGVVTDRRSDWQKDCLAAARLLWARWGGVWQKLWLLSLIGVALAAWIHRLFGTDVLLASSAIAGVMAVTQAPLLLWSIFAVDWSGPDVERKASGFDAFLLRSPIPSSRLLFVAVVARHAAIAISLLMIAIAIELSMVDRSEHERWIYPALWISLGTGSMAVLAFCWRPFSWNGYRVLTLLVLIPSGYMVMCWPLVALNPGHPKWLLLAYFPWLLLLLWGGTLWVTYRSLELARANSYGLDDAGSITARIRESSSSIGERILGVGASVRRSGQASALAWFDGRQSRAMRWSMIAWIGVPALVLLACLPLNFASVVVASLIVLTFTAVSTAGGWGETSSVKRGPQGRAMPLLLAVSPVSREVLAAIKVWRTTRLVLLASVVTFGVLGVFSIPANQPVWNRWAESMASGTGVSSFAMGLRVSLAIAMFSTMILVGRGIAMLWLALMADRRVTAAVTFLASGLLIWGSFRLGSWFASQSEWEVMLQEFRLGVLQIPTWVTWLLWAKLATFVMAFVQAIRQPGRPKAWVAKSVAAWCVSVVLLSAVLMMVLPERINLGEPWNDWTPMFSLVVMVIALVIPLARVLILPWAVGRDLHR